MRVGASLGASNARANAATATQLGARDTESVVGEFSVCCFATPGARHLPPIIRHFQNHYPDVRLMVREGDIEELSQRWNGAR
jgi:DNA-binding transcriptional LysR family regulator